MSKLFQKELAWTNYLLLGSFALMLVAANLYYGGSQQVLGRTLPIMIILAVALVLKLRLISRKERKLDERAQYIMYRSLSIGFYFLLGAVLWFYTQEMAVHGFISTRTMVELGAGALGYVGAQIVLARIH